jgi:hypothetical protein
MRLHVVVVMVLMGCGRPDRGPGRGTPPERFCPGADGCKKGSDGTLKVGVSVQVITPEKYELPKPEALKNEGDGCHEKAVVGADGKKRCGAIRDGLMTICNNGLCKGDFFFDCGVDQKCPGAEGYVGPDADGSEGDGLFQGFWIAGYGRNLPMANVNDDLKSSCLALVNGDISIGICTVDVVGLFRDDVDRIRREVLKLAPGYDYLLVSATHTHHGVDTEGQWGPGAGLPTRGVNDVWLNQVLVARTAQAAANALMSAKPARMFTSQVRLGAEVMNNIVTDTRDPYVIDDTLSAVRFTERDGATTIATFVSWGNHPEALAGNNNTVTADYVWALREGVEKGVSNSAGQLVRQGVGGSTVFFAGAVGGLMTSLGVAVKDVDGRPTPQRSVAKAKAVGDHLAISTLDALMGAAEDKAPTLAFGAQSLLVRLENQIFQLAAGSDLFKRRVYEYDAAQLMSDTNYPKVLSEISQIRVGRLRLIGVPGEIAPELAVGYDVSYAFGKPQLTAENPAPIDLSKAMPGPYLKEIAGGEMPCIIGLANDHIGYLIPPTEYVLHPTMPYLSQAVGDHYEETNSLGPSAVPTLWSAWKTLFAWEPEP